MEFLKKVKKAIKKNEINTVNSYASVRCVSSEICGHRFTEMCKTCGNNIGPETFKSCYVRRED